MSELHRETEMTRTDVADSLREFANDLDPHTATDPTRSEADGQTDDRVTVVFGNESATINPPENVDLVVDVDSASDDSSLIGSDDEEAIQFEIRWLAEETEDDGDVAIK
jgi:hypothetical protein